jgi:alpha-tubulin suppressor-like RCC1 family protein
MLGVNTLIQKLNTVIAGGSLTELQVVQLSKAIDTLENNGVSSVKTVADLPNPVINQGRFFWIESENRYTFSNGITWDINNIIKTPLTNLFVWGTGTYGILGNNSIVNRSSPVSAVGGFTSWVQVSAGSAHSLGIRANGTLYAWGINQAGILGTNELVTVSRSSPVLVAGGITDWTQVSLGRYHSLGLRATGQLYSWGSNSSGKLGQNLATVTNISSPALVAGSITDWKQVSGGLDFSLGVRATGQLYSWGSNNGGQLGQGIITTTSRSSPVLVAGGITDWIQASAGGTHGLGIRATGQLYAWGAGADGRLGDNTVAAKSSPILVAGGLTDWTQASAGYWHNLAIRATGQLYSWGSNNGGQLGQNILTTVSTSSPVLVVGGFTDWINASVSCAEPNFGRHSLGVRANGTLWAWGRNINGQLGDNTTTSTSSPVSVVGGFTDWIDASAGTQHSLGIRG